MEVDRLRLQRAALDGDQGAQAELWRLNARQLLPASSACCGPCDRYLRCRTSERTIDELALEFGLNPARFRDQMEARLQREPGRRELRGALTVAMDLMAAHDICGSAAWRTVMGLVLPDPWGHSFDDSEPRRVMHAPCRPDLGLCWPGLAFRWDGSLDIDRTRRCRSHNHGPNRMWWELCFMSWPVASEEDRCGQGAVA